MSSWVVEHASTLYLVLAVAGIILLGAWYIARSSPRRGGVPASRRPYLLGLGSIVLLMGVVWTIDHLTVTDGKRIERALEEMSAGVHNQDVARIFAQISPTFHWAGHSQTSFRPFVERHLNTGHVTDVTIWDVDVREVSREKRQATVTFKGKAHGAAFTDSAQGAFNCRATFHLDDDNQWRMQTFELFQPHIDPMHGEPMQIPIG